MDTKYPSLTKEDCEFMLEHLDASLTILRDCLRPGFDLIKIKSMLSVLRNELYTAGLTAAAGGEKTFTD